MKLNLYSIFIVFSIVSCEMDKKEERFFTREEYENEIHQEVNIDVLERIRNDVRITANELIFSFYFITDKREKIDSLIDYIEEYEKDQNLIELNQINSIWELNGRTYPIKLDLDSINAWERKMWGIGYKFDCKLDGWNTVYPD